jgi:hypothetical protein
MTTSFAILFQLRVGQSRASQAISANAYMSGNSGAVHAKVVGGTPRTILTMLVQHCPNTKVEEGLQVSQAKRLTKGITRTCRQAFVCLGSSAVAGKKGT